MSIKHKHIIFKGVTALAVTFLFSCSHHSGDIQRFNQRGDGPSAEGEGIVLKYIDSGKVVATLRTLDLLDYGTSPFPYQEFPKGVNITFVGDDNKENFVRADYAKLFEPTNLIDLRHNVVVILSDSTILKTSQLYWDQEKSWVFTDKAYTIDFPDGSFNNGQGFDSSENFKNFLSSGNNSRMYVKDTDIKKPKDSLP